MDTRTDDRLRTIHGSMGGHGRTDRLGNHFKRSDQVTPIKSLDCRARSNRPGQAARTTPQQLVADSEGFDLA